MRRSAKPKWSACLEVGVAGGNDPNVVLPGASWLDIERELGSGGTRLLLLHGVLGELALRLSKGPNGLAVIT